MLSAPPRPYFENAVGRLYQHPDGFALFRFKPGKRTFLELQGLLTQVRALLTRNSWHRFLADQILLAPFTPEEAAWIVTHWSTAAAQRPGGICGAVVLAQDVFARLAMGQVAHQANAQGMLFRLFETEAQAIAWLQQNA
ncbi:MAG: hypothetical protein H7Z21_20180 [Hymenobacter sp.]|nr:hypothetical protein [Hymenobacter sp.]